MVDKRKAAILRGERTSRWLEESEVQRVFTELAEDIAAFWANTASDQDEERERLYREMHGLRALRKRILQVVHEGKKNVVEVEADERSSRAQRARSGERNQRNSEQGTH